MWFLLNTLCNPWWCSVCVLLLAQCTFQIHSWWWPESGHQSPGPQQPWPRPGSKLVSYAAELVPDTPTGAVQHWNIIFLQSVIICSKRLSPYFIISNMFRISGHVQDVEAEVKSGLFKDRKPPGHRCTYLRFSPPSEHSNKRPFSSPDTKDLRWACSSADQICSSVWVSKGSRFILRVPEKSTGSWAIEEKVALIYILINF